VRHSLKNKGINNCIFSLRVLHSLHWQAFFFFYKLWNYLCTPMMGNDCFFPQNHCQTRQSLAFFGWGEWVRLLGQDRNHSAEYAQCLSWRQPTNSHLTCFALWKCVRTFVASVVCQLSVDLLCNVFLVKYAQRCKRMSACKLLTCFCGWWFHFTVCIFLNKVLFLYASYMSTAFVSVVKNSERTVFHT